MSTQQSEAGAYVPRPGDRVTVRRYQQPTLADGDPQRAMTFQVTGTLTDVRPKAGGHLLYFDPLGLAVQYDDDGHREPGMFDVVSTGYVFFKPDYLVTEVVPAAGTAGEAFRVQVSPDMAVVTDVAQCIVLEIRVPATGFVVHKVTVTDVDHLKVVLDAAREAQHAALAVAEERRLRGPDEKRRAEGRLTKSEAVEWLIGQGLSRGYAIAHTSELRNGERDLADGMTYDGTCWVVPAQQG